MHSTKAKDQRNDGADVKAPVPGERHRRRIVIGLAGLLGAAWAVVIVSRFPGILPG